MLLQIDRSLSCAQAPRRAIAAGYQPFDFQQGNVTLPAPAAAPALGNAPGPAGAREPSQLRLGKRRAAAEWEVDTYRIQYADRVQAFRRYVQYFNTHRPPVSAANVTECNFAHYCTQACQFFQFRTLHTCAESGQTHECTALVCDRLIECSDCIVCELTGAHYPRNFASERPKDAANPCHNGDEPVDCGGDYADRASSFSYAEYGDVTDASREQREERALELSQSINADGAPHARRSACDQKTAKLLQKIRDAEKHNALVTSTVATAPRTGEEDVHNGSDDILHSDELSVPTTAVMPSPASAASSSAATGRPPKRARKAVEPLGGLPLHVACYGVVRSVFARNQADANPRAATMASRGNVPTKRMPTEAELNSMAAVCAHVWQTLTQTRSYGINRTRYTLANHVLVVLTCMQKGFTLKRAHGEDVVVVPHYALASELMHTRAIIIAFNGKAWNGNAVTVASNLFREFVKQAYRHLE